MENQKILWIVFSIALFVLVVVVVGFIWILPPDTGSGGAFANADVVSETTEDAYDPIEWMRETAEIPGLTEGDNSGDGNLLLVIGATEDDQATAESDDQNMTTNRSGNLQETTIRVATPPQRVVETGPTPESTGTRAVTTSRGAAADSARSAAANSVQPRSVRVTLFWIQAGSYLSRSRAEEANVSLAKAGVTGRITSANVSGETYYRVRIGPYEAKAEADKFLTWLKDIESFEGSYISEVYTTTTVN